MNFWKRKTFELNQSKNKLIVLLLNIPVGNRCEEIYYALLKARREGKRTLFFRVYHLLPWKFNFRYTNNSVLHIKSPFNANEKWILSLFGNILLSAILLPGSVCKRVPTAINKRIRNNFFLKPIYWLLSLLIKVNPVLTEPIACGWESLWAPGKDLEEFSWADVEGMEWRKQIGTPLPIEMCPKKMERAHKIRLKMGIPEGDWFICLHIREGGFHKDWESSKYRNADIFNYTKAIEYVTGKGGWVVRLGDTSMKKLPKINRVIDYPFTPFKSALMDVYLISECRFYSGTTSGIFDMAILFQKPMVLANIYTWIDSSPPRRGDLGILKHFYSKSKGRYLSVQEILEIPPEKQGYSEFNKDEELQMHENSPEEIYDLFVEFYENFEHRQEEDLSELQKEYARSFYEQGRKALLECKIVTGNDTAEGIMFQKYRFAAKVCGFNGTLGRGFLEKNWEKSSRSQ
jgi:putative glycosyltransferase (TIGR04372 family)